MVVAGEAPHLFINLLLRRSDGGLSLGAITASTSQPNLAIS